MDNHEEKEIADLTAHNHSHHEHRGLEEVIEIINNTDITKNAKEIAIKIFKILGKVSIGSLYRWRALLDYNKDWTALVGQYKYPKFIFMKLGL